MTMLTPQGLVHEHSNICSHSLDGPLPPGRRRTLVVDDNRVLRHEDEFDDEVSYALTSAAALRELQNSVPYDVIWLDHDLGGDDTTLPVVDWLVQNPIRGPEYVVVHTQNPVGRKRIIQALERLYDIGQIFDVGHYMRRRTPAD